MRLNINEKNRKYAPQIIRAANESKQDRLNLIYAELRGADLSEAELRGAELRGADLRGSDLHGAALSGANLIHADLRGAVLHGADLRGADLFCANLRGAELHGADLSGAELHGADLSGAGLFSAELHSADLFQADLSGANLSGAELTNVTMNWYSRTLVAERLRQAAAGDVILLMAVALIEEGEKQEWCWKELIQHGRTLNLQHPEHGDVFSWTINAMRGWVKEGDILPSRFKQALGGTA